MSRKGLAFSLLGVAGLGLYLWAALASPVVSNSDSALDLKWARTSPLHASDPDQPHPAKPGYLLFLAAALRLFPSLPENRSVVVVQSILLWLSIAWTSWRLARRRGAIAGLALLALLLVFLRLRDASSAILSDAAAAALLLPIVALCLDPPRSRIGFGVLGIASALLFWIRPNVGFAAILLSPILLWRPEARRGLAILLVCLAVLMVPAWILTRPKQGGDSLRGLGAPVLMGSARYYWMPWLGGLPLPEEDSSSRLRKAAANWRSFLSPGGADMRRELTWRLLHGFLGADYYDARWSPMYRRADTLSREASPFLVLAAIGVLVGSAAAGGGVPRRERIADLLLLAFLLGHDLLFGSHPRYILPFLPVVFLFSVSQAAAWRESPARPAAIAAVLFAALVALSARNRGILDWEWGLIERPGVRIRQTIPRRALPASPPATLHVRVAPLVLPTAAYLEIRGESEELLFTSRDAPPENPFVSVPLPESILRSNRTRAVTLTLVSVGDYDSVHFLIFPVVPPPWPPEASREASPELSPGTGIARGALDWWAHSGRVGNPRAEHQRERGEEGHRDAAEGALDRVERIEGRDGEGHGIAEDLEPEDGQERIGDSQPGDQQKQQDGAQRYDRLPRLGAEHAADDQEKEGGKLRPPSRLEQGQVEVAPRLRAAQQVEQAPVHRGRKREQQHSGPPRPSGEAAGAQREHSREQQNEERALLLQRRAVERGDRQTQARRPRVLLQEVEGRARREDRSQSERDLRRSGVDGAIQEEAQRGERRGGRPRNGRDAPREKSRERAQCRQLAGRKEQRERLIVPGAAEEGERGERQRNEERVLAMRPRQCRVVEHPLGKRAGGECDLALQAPDREKVGRPHRLRQRGDEKDSEGHCRDTEEKDHDEPLGTAVVRADARRGAARRTRQEAYGQGDRVGREESCRPRPDPQSQEGEHQDRVAEQTGNEAPRRRLPAGQAGGEETRRGPAREPGGCEPQKNVRRGG